MQSTHSKITSLSILATILVTRILFAQEVHFENIQKALNSNRIKNILFELKKIDTSKINKYDKATLLFYYANYELIRDNQHLAYKHLLNSKKMFSSLNKLEDVADCNILLLETLSHQQNITINSDKILEELESYALNRKDSTALLSVYHRIAVKFLDLNNSEKSILYFKKIIPLITKKKDSVRIGHVFTNIGTVHSVVLKNADSSLYYAKKAVSILKRHNDYQTLAYNFNNQAQQYKLLQKYSKAIIFYKKADSIILKRNVIKSKIIFYTNLAETYELAKNYKNASFFLNKLIKLKDSINETQQNIAISEIKEKYDNQKLRADNLESEARRKKNKILLVASLTILFFGSITAILIQKNTKRKQRLAEQEKELETQKLVGVLKEQELTTIDAIIEGQEKERQRIANDLHDDLGGLLATVKLHFNLLKEKKSEELFNKTNVFIDEAYQKVRTLAHAKNSGVIAKQGLLIAVQNMSEKIAALDKIKIDVIHHGLSERLENKLEITLFRIIQELVTNTLKHAEATELTIYLTNHEDRLNIMVEDNGKGFTPSQITTKNKGMGIHSIDKRVEFLNGTMIIESALNKGTSIIIDIAL